MNNKIVYGILVCDFDEGMGNLSCDEMLDLLGYDDLEEFKEDVGYDEDEEVDEDDVYEYFDNHYEVYYNNVIEDNGLEILSEKEYGYYKGSCGPFSKFIYKVKGLKEDFESIEKVWFVVDSKEIDLEDLFVNYDD